MNKYNKFNHLLKMNNIIPFQIIHEKEVWSPFLLSSELKIIN